MWTVLGVTERLSKLLSRAEVDAEERLEEGDKREGERAGGGRDRTGTGIMIAFAYLTSPPPG